MKLGYVCVNFNNSHTTREAIRTFLRTAPEGRVVVVDNGSGTADIECLKAMRNEYPSIVVVFHGANVGYFGGLNVGIKALRSNFPAIDLIVVGNNDLKFPECFYRQVELCLPRFGDHPVISPDIITLDGVHQNPHVIARVSWKRELVYDLYYSNYYVAKVISKVAHATRWCTGRDDRMHWRVARSIYSGHGSCYILGPVFFKYWSFLWAPTFMMGEEYFLSKQLADRGMGIYYEPAIQVVHEYHASVGQMPARKMWTLGRDAHRVYRKYVKVFGS